MSRLIDADALNKELQKRVGSPTDEKLYEANLCIIDAPTIDAIPVEWLEQQFYDNPRSEWANKCRDVYTGWVRWQKEQEAHGT